VFVNELLQAGYSLIKERFKINFDEEISSLLINKTDFFNGI
jgi:hypothetical protein